jgi:hypothetical protein
VGRRRRRRAVKGFHAAVLDPTGLVCPPGRLADEAEALEWLTANRPRAIAVDGPRAPAPAGQTSRPEERRFLCETADEGMLAQAERYRTNEYDSLGYWAERDMDPDVLDRYRGSVFLIQGLQDWNVDRATSTVHQRPGAAGDLRQAHDRSVESHLSRPRRGARSDFADILLRWWDRWLGGDRGQRTGPRVEVQDSDLRWRTERSWPPARDAAQPVPVGG